MTDQPATLHDLLVDAMSNYDRYRQQAESFVIDAVDSGEYDDEHEPDDDQDQDEAEDTTSPLSPERALSAASTYARLAQASATAADAVARAIAGSRSPREAPASEG